MHVLLVPSGSAGDTHPFVGLGLGLRARGHRVTFIQIDYFGPLVRKLGFESVPLGNDEQYLEVMKDPNLWHPRKGLKIVMASAVEGARRTYPLIAERYVPGETIVAAGSLALGARLAQEKLGVPTASVHLQPSFFRSVHETPIYGKLRMGEWLPKPFKRLMFRLIDHIVDGVLTPGLNAYRAELGLAPVRRAMDQWWDSPQLVLGLFPDWFAAIQPDWPKQLRLTGFPLYDERDANPIAPEVLEFLDAGAPPVVFTPGSAMIHGRPFFEAAADACVRLGARGLFLTRFPDQVPAGLPEGVRHFAYAPFSQLLPRASVLVHHGGIGTSAQGMAAGVPQLVMPLAYDQFDNAARLERLGVARSIPSRRFQGPAVAEAIRPLLGSPKIASRCREIAARFSDAHPQEEACDALETLAEPTLTRA